MQRRRKQRTPPPPKEPPRILRCVVVGKCRVLGRSVGEYVELPEEQANRLIGGGHVELAPEPPKPKPKPASYTRKLGESEKSRGKSAGGPASA